MKSYCLCIGLLMVFHSQAMELASLYYYMQRMLEEKEQPVQEADGEPKTFNGSKREEGQEIILNIIADRYDNASTENK